MIRGLCMDASDRGPRIRQGILLPSSLQAWRIARAKLQEFRSPILGRSCDEESQTDPSLQLGAADGRHYLFQGFALSYPHFHVDVGSELRV